MIAWLLFGGLGMILACIVLCGTCFLQRLLRCLRTRCLNPELQDRQKVTIEYKGNCYRTVIWTVEQDQIWLVSPCVKGLPLSLQPGTPITLTVQTADGLFTAVIETTERKAKLCPLLGVERPKRWQWVQRRRHERYVLSDEPMVTLQAPDRKVTGWLLDVGAGGARIHTRHCLPTGTVLSIQLPDSFIDHAMPCTQHAPRSSEVVACERVLHRSNYEYALRIAFAETIENLHAPA